MKTDSIASSIKVFVQGLVDYPDRVKVKVDNDSVIEVQVARADLAEVKNKHSSIKSFGCSSAGIEPDACILRIGISD